ncbi:OsmC family protein [Acetobacter conturbans]|uniref:OsmC family peroxiredoxin n=1 Tax=Acetobacter conturbans TaxID=1737472 RepID=A0ABX0K394_9PROT|nr:OsmC family protein [Acetobacter conturbans]NHN90173.1 OsmC family peroxiredoxin [Acetobacter conturbans]
MILKRHAVVSWAGGFKGGKGNISTESGALESYPYGYSNRFGDQKGTNPEELLGAAHASCFTMALSRLLEEEGLTATALDTQAEVTLEQLEGSFKITKINLKLRAFVPGADSESFAAIAAKAKQGCPISKALNAEITLDAALVG